MHLSRFGKRFSKPSGILELMQDLDLALNQDGQMLMLGGGNPCRIPEVESELQACMSDILADGNSFALLLSNYDHPQGHQEFIVSLAAFFREHFQWDIGPQNIALSNGSQHSFFNLFSLLAGEYDQQNFRRVLLPMTPEYIGYADAGIHSNLFYACRPEFELLNEHEFLYRLPMAELSSLPKQSDSSVLGAMCVSRPSNPTAKMLDDQEMDQLIGLAGQLEIPLIVDSAYGLPFPGIVDSDATLIWQKNMVVTLSLSKFGMPGVRTGIVIADAGLIEVLARLNAISSLATGSLGPALGLRLIQKGLLLSLSQGIIQPHYQNKARKAQSALHESMQKHAPDVNYRMHKCEGAFFLWLWLPDFPIPSRRLYERLKAKGVIVVPGEYYFPGLEYDDWKHKQECLRISFAQSIDDVARGLELLAIECQQVLRECSE